MWSWSEVREMKTNNFGPKSVLMLIIISMITLSAAIVYGLNSVEPSNANSITYVSNSTNTYALGNTLNYTKGYIWTVNIQEYQPSSKWIGYVGNISGKFALQDAQGFALYDWTITTITGKIYATRFNNFVQTALGQAGTPNWEAIACANDNNVTVEEQYFNHTISFGATNNEDSLTRTFISGTTHNTFSVGQDITITANSCPAVHLNVNNTHAGTGNNWSEVILTDGTTSVVNGQVQTKMIFASLLQNRTLGYRNDSRFDFQILLPQTGIPVSTVNTGYYFYVELS
jgi:hypothetical protein